MWSSPHIIIFITTFFIIENVTAAKEVAFPVYKLMGETVHLSTGKQNESMIRWQRDATVIAKINHKVLQINEVFKGKFDVNVTDGSLIIENVTEKDGGHYTVTTGEWTEETKEYHLIIEEAVSEPVIRTDLLQFPLNSSSDACHVSVTCSADGDSVTYDCRFEICTLTNSSLSKVNISVTLTHSGNVECSASNHVSTKTSSELISNTCSKKSPPVKEESNLFLILAIAIGCGLGGLLVASVFIGWYCSRKKLQNDGTHPEEITTVYSVVCKPRPQPETNTAATTTVYDVPSKCVVSPQGAKVQTPTTTQERPPQEKPGTANTHREEEPENDTQLTVYWKLGQK